MASILSKLQKWYEGVCNGDWEHSYGVRIETLDNPGWLVTIDLIGTEWESLSVSRRITERSERDWIQYEVIKGQFVACGGVWNLQEILMVFAKLVSQEQN